MRNDVGDSRMVPVYICRIRKKIGKFTIKNDWGGSYYMPKEGAEKVLSLLNA
jgi:DNA-binding response OmpR family regulator